MAAVTTKQIGPYSILGELGRGGMGVVYRARREDLNREFALKVMLRPDDPKAAERFLREARAAAALSGHPGIVAVHDVGEAEDGSLYLAMDCVRGAALDQMLDEMQLDPKEWAQIVGHAAEAIHFAHAHGILHRDIKPGNILVDGEMRRARVTDFGLAFRNEDIKLTNSGDIVGTPAYMSPEQATGDPLDERSDVWSLGATLYECLTGRPPFDGATALNVLTAIMTKEPRRMTGLPRDIAAITMKCLEKESDRRYPSALALAQDIGRFIEGKPVIAKPAGVFDRLRKKIKRNPVAAGALALATAATAIGGAVVGFQYLQAQARQEGITQAFIDAGNEYRTAYEGAEGREREENYIAAWSAYQGAHRLLTKTPEHPAYGIAEQSLADMAWERLQAAEAYGIADEAARFYNDLKKYGAAHYANALQGDGALSFDTEPSGATIECFKYVDEGGRLIETPFMELGQTPLTNVTLPMGSYLLIIKKEGYRDTRYPVLIERLEQDVIKEPIPLYANEQVGKEFVYIPAGESIMGGDPKAYMGKPRQKRWIDGFLIARHEVTLSEYGEFLVALLNAGISSEEVQKRCPRNSKGGKYFWTVKGKRVTNSLGDDYLTAPVFGISWYDAKAYCAWRSEKEGRVITLPTVHEWLRAARGADDRAYVWGNGFDNSWAVLGDYSGGKHSQIYPVMHAKEDVSPFGVHDLVGSMREWCLDEDSHEGVYLQRGANWNAAGGQTRLASYGSLDGSHVRTNLGFRVCAQPKK
jgi:serine/threonine-protein kinase